MPLSRNCTLVPGVNTACLPSAMRYSAALLDAAAGILHPRMHYFPSHLHPIMPPLRPGHPPGLNTFARTPQPRPLSPSHHPRLFSSISSWPPFRHALLQTGPALAALLRWRLRRSQPPGATRGGPPTANAHASARARAHTHTHTHTHASEPWHSSAALAAARGALTAVAPCGGEVRAEPADQAAAPPQTRRRCGGASLGAPAVLF
jgi:hypothetical protein